MLFNSYSFIFLFLPVVFALFIVFGRIHYTLAASWLAIASIFFYGWWNIAFVPLLLASIVFNYGAGYAIAKTRSKPLLIGAIALNLTLLGYYKYANFFISNMDRFSGLSLHLSDIVLPIGISFFTFTQIAFLVDGWIGKAKEYRFIHYCLFVSYFPHLIAGPVLHHGQMMPQFAERTTYRFNWNNIAIGLTIFAIGLFKKTVLADSIAAYASPIFDGARDGAQIYFFEAWIGAIAYTLQLYFDFSGYCDMAIGLSRLFNIKLPLNFHSPYKAVNIIEFWRRWHMTLSRFLRDYLYFPLGGNRRGLVRRHINLFITMLLGGLWHGAGWTFVIWGGLHGMYLIINHGWRAVRTQLGYGKSHWLGRASSILLTFIAVIFAWVFFRAADLRSALYLIESMFGLHGFSLPESMAGNNIFNGFAGRDVLFAGLLTNIQANTTTVCLWVTTLLAIVWLLPNTQQIMASYEPTSDRIAPPLLASALHWHPTRPWIALIALLFGMGVMELGKVSEFLYFQF